MRNSFLFLVLVALISSASLLAQRGGHLPPMLHLTDELKTELGLNAEQVAAIETLQAETKEAADALREQDGLERRDRRTALREIHQNVKARLTEILSEEQLAQLRNIMDEKQAEHRELMESVDHKALQEEMRLYRETNIEPVMSTQRSKLEQQLSAEDKATLAAFRSTLAAAKEQARAERRQAREKRQAQEVEGEQPPHIRRQRHHGPKGKSNLREKHPEIFNALTTMVEAYDAEITPLLDEVANQREQWKTDMKAIKERHIPAELNERHQAHQERRSNHPEHDTRRERGMKIRFLLRESQAAADLEEDAETAAIAATAYPNPAVNTTTLSFDLVETMVIRIDLRDEQGGLVKNITRDTYQAGKNQIAIDLGDLNNGTYYLTLNSRSFKAPQSVKVVLVK